MKTGIVLVLSGLLALSPVVAAAQPQQVAAQSQQVAAQPQQTSGGAMNGEASGDITGLSTEVMIGAAAIGALIILCVAVFCDGSSSSTTTTP